MPTLNETNVVHLLRRTEFVARPDRVAALLGAASFEAAVDDVLAVPANPGTCQFTREANWERGQELVHYWIDRMAYDSPRPIQERMALFWHGHFVSSMDKVGKAELMREQIDLWRHHGLGNVRHLAVTMSTQVAMLRYLDNNDNRRTSPNQNFGRELMELFLLGVGNYTEADVEACSAAWTGHTDDWETGAYEWRGGEPGRADWQNRNSNWHDYSRKRFLGQTINTDNSFEGGRTHGAETILTMLGNGVVPIGPNAGRPSREVVAEFLSRKLWTFFAGTTIPSGVLAALRDALVNSDFAVRPWLRALLLRDEFYATDVRQGLLRSPVEYIVAMLVTTGLRSPDATPTWLMDGMGQALLYPPNVSGWRHNGYYVSASAFGDRTAAARQMMWRVLDRYWGDDGDGSVRLVGGVVPAQDLIDGIWQMSAGARPAAKRAIVDQLIDASRIDLDVAGSNTRSSLYAFADQAQPWELVYVVGLLLMSPEMHVL